MNTHGSATALEQSPHETETTTITISDALRRRAQAVNDTPEAMREKDRYLARLLESQRTTETFW